MNTDSFIHTTLYDLKSVGLKFVFFKKQASRYQQVRPTDSYLYSRDPSSTQNIDHEPVLLANENY